MDFTAIDFETATSKSTSVCSLGICVVENNRIAEQKELLFRPEPFEFNDYNIRIHGITPADVAARETFNAYWDEIRPYLDLRLIVAHNAPFDVGALRATLDLFGLEYPTFRYLCTVILSQKAYPELPSHKLNHLCQALEIHFNHHHAMDDAYACASVLIRICQEFHLNTPEEIVEKFGISIGSVYPGCRQDEEKRKRPRRPYRRRIVRAQSKEAAVKN